MSLDALGLPDVILIGLAAASLFKLVAVDKVTSAPRHWVIRHLRYTRQNPPDGADTHPSRSRWANWLEYLWGCALCFPMWGAILFVSTYDWTPTRWVVLVLAVRFVAWMSLRWLQEQNVRDWPEGFNWPPDD